MGLLDDQLAIDAESFADTDAFGETVTYTPAVGSARSVSAVVMREPLERRQEALNGVRERIVCYLRNDATLGVLASGVNRSGDTITVAWKRGGTTKVYRVVEVIEQDAGMVKVALQ